MMDADLSDIELPENEEGGNVNPEDSYPQAVPMQEHELTVQGIPVTFPFQPNASQSAIMPKLVQAIMEKKNLLLESPSGTGKSLAMLCTNCSCSERN